MSTLAESGAAPAHSPTRLRYQFAWTLAGNVVYAACQWGMLVVIAKVGTVTMLGQFSLALAITVPVLTLTNLQLRSIQATDVTGRFGLGDYLGARIGSSSLALGVILLLAAFMPASQGTAPVLAVIGVAKCVESLADAIYGHFQGRERMDLIAQSMIIKGLASLTALGLGLYLAKSMVIASLALAATWLLVTAAFDAPNLYRLSAVDRTERRLAPILPRWNPARQRELLRITLPMGVALAVMTLATSAPRYFIQHDLGEAPLGYFSALAYPTTALGIVVSALGQAATPRLARARADGRRFWSLVAMLSAVTTILLCAGLALALVAGRQVLTLLYKPEYAEHVHLLILLIIGAGFWAYESVFGFAATAAGRFREQSIAAIVILSSTIAACWILVPRYGLVGAGWATIVSGVVALGSFATIAISAMRRTVPAA